MQLLVDVVYVEKFFSFRTWRRVSTELAEVWRDTRSVPSFITECLPSFEVGF
jgi:hypothetical protein